MDRSAGINGVKALSTGSSDSDLPLDRTVAVSPSQKPVSDDGVVKFGIDSMYSEVSSVNLRSRLKITRDLYAADGRPWVVAFSGGKDSTAILQLIWMALAQLHPRARSKAVDVCYVDTGMDHPLYREQVAKTLERIEEVSNRERMPFRFTVIEPELKHRFFVLVLGRGYAPPTHWFRWCTKAMGIRPMSDFIRRTVSRSGSVVIALGLRRSESNSRRQVLEKFSSGVPFLSNYGSMKNAAAFRLLRTSARRKSGSSHASACPLGRPQSGACPTLYRCVRGRMCDFLSWRTGWDQAAGGPGLDAGLAP